MRKLLSNIIIIGLILALGIFILKESGYNLDSLLNKTKTYELKVDCSEIENLLVTSVTELTVSNTGNKNHDSVTVRITAFNQENDIIKQKNVVFERTLTPNGTLSKIITLPAKTVNCKCIVLDSNPDN